MIQKRKILVKKKNEKSEIFHFNIWTLFCVRKYKKNTKLSSCDHHRMKLNRNRKVFIVLIKYWEHTTGKITTQWVCNQIGFTNLIKWKFFVRSVSLVNQKTNTQLLIYQFFFKKQFETMQKLTKMYHVIFVNSSKSTFIIHADYIIRFVITC